MINYIHYFMRNSSKRVAHKITNDFFNSLNLIIKLIIMPEHLILILFTKELVRYQNGYGLQYKKVRTSQSPHENNIFQPNYYF
jgi:hypothetical protein